MAMPASRSASDFSVPGVNQELIEAMRKYDQEKLAQLQETVSKEVSDIPAVLELKVMLQSVIKRLDVIEGLIKENLVANHTRAGAA
jgi:hypothetical protein